MSGKVTARIELPKLTNAIDDATAATLTQFAGDTLLMIRGDLWKGFKYGDYYPEEQKGTSGNSWKVTHLQPGEAGFSYGFMLYNDAQVKARGGTKRNGQPYANTNAGAFYAGFVQKSGHPQQLWMEVVDSIETKLVPDFETELLINILNAAADGAVAVELEADDQGVRTYEFDL